MLTAENVTRDTADIFILSRRSPVAKPNISVNPLNKVLVTIKEFEIRKILRWTRV